LPCLARARPDRRTRLPTEGIAAVMLLDVSGSMAEPDYDWDGEPVERLEAVKRAFRLFVEGGAMLRWSHTPGRPTDLLGLVTFATRPDSPCPLTLSPRSCWKCLTRTAAARLVSRRRTSAMRSCSGCTALRAPDRGGA
jgi:Ca-activated chloride channel family protein